MSAMTLGAVIARRAFGGEDLAGSTTRSALQNVGRFDVFESAKQGAQSGRGGAVAAAARPDSCMAMHA